MVIRVIWVLFGIDNRKAARTEAKRPHQHDTISQMMDKEYYLDRVNPQGSLSTIVSSRRQPTEAMARGAPIVSAIRSR